MSRTRNTVVVEYKEIPFLGIEVDHDTWDIFTGVGSTQDKNFGPKIFLGRFEVPSGHLIQLGETADTNLFNVIRRMMLERILSEQCTFENIMEDAPEITSPRPIYYEYAPGIETIQSCLDSTDYVMAHSRHDIQVMLMRILQNQRTILRKLGK